MRALIAATAFTVALVALGPALVVAGEDGPDDVRSLGTLGWAGRGSETLDVTVPMHSAYAFLFAPYCQDPGKRVPYSARVDGPGVRDELPSGIPIARDLGAGAFRFTVDTGGDTSDCSWALFVDSISAEELEEDFGLSEEIQRGIAEARWRSEGIDPVVCSSSAGSVVYLETVDAGTLDFRWSCANLETEVEEETRLAEERAARESEEAARQAAQARQAELLTAMPPAPEDRSNCASTEGQTGIFEGATAQALGPEWSCSGLPEAWDVECRTEKGSTRILTQERARALQEKWPDQWTCELAST